MCRTFRYIATLIIGFLAVLPCLAQRRAPKSDPTVGSSSVTVFVSASVAHSLEELVSRSDLIVDGVVQEVLPTRLWDPEDRISHCTDSVVVPSRFLKGGAAGKIAVVQRGGALNGVTVVANDDPIMQPGQRYVLFLVKETRPPAGSQMGFFRITGVWSGSFRVIDGKVAAHTNASPELKKYQNQTLDGFLGAIEKQVASTVVKR